MHIVIPVALGVGGATVIGAIIGFAFKSFSKKFSNIVLAFAAGIMLAASVLGLILPSLDYGGSSAIWITVIGIFVGAACMSFLDKTVVYMQKDSKARCVGNSRVMLFVLAIAIHNLPEGIAAGVGFGAGNSADAMLIAIGIAFQNIPEGMIIISPMLSAGVKPLKAFVIAILTGVIEIVGTFAGYFAVKIAVMILPFALSFAGGTMIYVICNDMIPEAQSKSNGEAYLFMLIAGFCLMLAVDFFL